MSGNPFAASLPGNVKGITVGFVQVTPPTGGGVGSAAVSGLNTVGQTFAVFLTASSTRPDLVTELTVSDVTATGFTVYMNRTSGATTGIYYAHIGY